MSGHSENGPVDNLTTAVSLYFSSPAGQESIRMTLLSVHFTLKATWKFVALLLVILSSRFDSSLKGPKKYNRSAGSTSSKKFPVVITIFFKIERKTDRANRPQTKGIKTTREHDQKPVDASGRSYLAEVNASDEKTAQRCSANTTGNRTPWVCRKEYRN